MESFENGSKVTWIKEMETVPHPEGKIGLDGNVLSVFRDTALFGRIIDKGINNKYWIRPEFAEAYKDKACGERYYDVLIEGSKISLV
jgi:hypothetical protein